MEGFYESLVILIIATNKHGVSTDGFTQVS